MERHETSRRPTQETQNEVTDLIPVLRMACGSAPYGIALTASDGRFLHVNSFVCDALGYSEEELLQLKFQDISHPEELEASLAGAKGLLDGGLGVFEIEKRYLHKDGRPVWLSLRSNVHRDGSGRPLCFVSHMQDITERKQAEEALRQSEERYRGLVELSQDGILIHSQGKVVFLNPAAARILGAEFPEQLINKNVLDLVHADSRAMVKERMQELKQESTFQPFVSEKLIRLDGTEIHIEAAGVPFVFQGKPATQVLIRDVTHAMLAEEALRRSEAKFRRVVESNMVGVTFWEANGNITDANDNYLAIIGYDREELKRGDVNWRQITPKEYAALDDQALRELAERGVTSPFEKEYVRKDGSRVPVMIAAALLGGAEDQGVCFVLDITSRKQAEQDRDRLFQQVESARDRLQLLSHRLVQVQELERRRIARELHDEVGQELTALRLTIEQCALATADDAKSSWRDAQERATKLLNVVRELSLELRPSMLDDLGLLPALIWHFDRYSTMSGIKVAFKHWGLEGQRFSPEIETAAYRIIQEALTNVLRHSGCKEVSVTLWLSDHNARLAMQIEDCGAGFEVETALKRGNSSGLSGMRERAALLGGRLTIESVPRERTCITAELPINPKSQIDPLQ